MGHGISDKTIKKDKKKRDFEEKIAARPTLAPYIWLVSNSWGKT